MANNYNWLEHCTRVPICVVVQNPGENDRRVIEHETLEGAITQFKEIKADGREVNVLNYGLTVCEANS